MLNSSMIEQLKQFVDRQTPVSLLIALVGVVFLVNSANRLLLTLTDGFIFWIRPFFPNSFSLVGPVDLFGLIQTLIFQVLILLILKLFIR
jgi:hypothetical protein